MSVSGLPVDDVGPTNNQPSTNVPPPSSLLFSASPSPPYLPPLRPASVSELPKKTYPSTSAAMAPLSEIPGPKGLPFLGNITDLDTDIPVLGLARLAKLHGPIYRLNLPGRRVIVCTSQKIVNELCDTTRFEKHVGGGLAEIRDVGGDGLFTAFNDEPNWALAHRILVPAFSPLALHDMFGGMQEVVSQMMLRWRLHGPQEPIDPVDQYTRLALDSIALCAMGYRFNSFFHDEQHPFVTAMVERLLAAGTRSNRPKFLNSWLEPKESESRNLMFKIADNIVSQRKAHPGCRKDLLSAMLEGQDKQTGAKLSDENIRYQMITFLIAGHETTSGLLSFATYYLCKSPHDYLRLQAEVDEVCGKGPITLQHLPKLKFVDAVLKEALRLTPTAVAFSVHCKEDETTIDDGRYAVTKDDSLLIVSYVAHRDPAVWKDPEEFNPSRMLDGGFENLPPNSWKPFGNGPRACIGRGFAMQEATLALARVFQEFDLTLQNPSAELQIKQTLTIKPKGLTMYATQRKGFKPYDGAGGGTVSTSSEDEQAGAVRQERDAGGKTRMHIFSGGNTGTCDHFAQKIAEGAPAHGFNPTIEPLDNLTGQAFSDGPVVIIAASFEGQPADNAARFVEWLKRDQLDVSLSSTKYAVMGAGHRDWAATFQRVPTLIDEQLAKHGAERLVERGSADAGGDDMFADFDNWLDLFWPKVTTAYGQTAVGGDEAPVGLDVVLNSLGTRATTLKQHDLSTAKVLGNRLLTKAGPEAREVRFALPEDVSYRAGDYLAILPINPPEYVRRVLKRFNMGADAELTIRPSRTTPLPADVPISITDLLGGYVELAQPITRKALGQYVAHAKDEKEKKELETLASDAEAFAAAVSRKRMSALDVLERFPSVDLPLSVFLALLPPLRVRQYSISSSPLVNPHECSISVGIIEDAALSGQGLYKGVCSNYIRQLEPGVHVRVAVRPSNVRFHLPDDTGTPVIMICAGTGIAPFHGFVQERAELVRGGRQLTPAVLIYGCRSPETDMMYGDELEAWQKAGVVEVRYAFSRSDDERAKGCKYAQDRLWLDRAELVELFKAGAKLFVCGSAAKLAQGVRETILRIRVWADEGKGGATSEEELKEWMAKVEAERLATDVFG